MEAFRFYNVLLIGLCVGFTAQAYGMFMGSMFEMKVSERSSYFKVQSVMCEIISKPSFESPHAFNSFVEKIGVKKYDVYDG